MNLISIVGLLNDLNELKINQINQINQRIILKNKNNKIINSGWFSSVEFISKVKTLCMHCIKYHLLSSN